MAQHRAYQNTEHVEKEHDMSNVEKYDPRAQSELRQIMSYQLVANELTDRRKAMMGKLHLDAGEKINIETEWGESLGSVSRSKVTYKAVVDDEALLLGSADEEDMEYAIAADEQELVDFLLNTAGGERFLTTRLRKVAMETMAVDALNTWRKTGQAPAGWRITESTPSTRATASKLAKDMVADFLTEHSAQLALNPNTTNSEEEK